MELYVSINTQEPLIQRQLVSHLQREIQTQRHPFQSRLLKIKPKILYILILQPKMLKLECPKVVVFKIMFPEVLLLDKLVFNGHLMVLQNCGQPSFLPRWAFH